MLSRGDIITRGSGLLHTIRPSYAEVFLFVAVRFFLVLVNLGCILTDMRIWHHHKLCEADRVCGATNPPDACEEFDSSMPPAILLMSLGALADMYVLLTIPHTLVIETGTTPQWQTRSDVRSSTILRVEITIEAVNVAMSGIAVIGVFYRYVILQVRSHEDEVYPETQHRTGVVLMVTMVTSALAAIALHLILLVNYVSILSKQKTEGGALDSLKASTFEREGLVAQSASYVDVPLDRMDGLIRRRPHVNGAKSEEEPQETDSLLL